MEDGVNCSNNSQQKSYTDFVAHIKFTSLDSSVVELVSIAL